MYIGEYVHVDDDILKILRIGRKRNDRTRIVPVWRTYGRKPQAIVLFVYLHKIKTERENYLGLDLAHLLCTASNNRFVSGTYWVMI